MVSRSSILAWEAPWTEEPSGLCQRRVVDGVADGVPDGIGVQVGPRLEQLTFGIALETAHQQAFLAELLGVEEVDLASLETRPVEGVVHHHQVRALKAV